MRPGSTQAVRRRPGTAVAAVAPWILLSALVGASEARLELVPSPEAGWPQLRGPRRDGISGETGLTASWPDGGPKVLWAASGLGNGYSAPVISAGRIIITGDIGDDLVIHALDLRGKPLWTSKNGRSWKGPYPGARALGTLAGGRVFHLNAHGRAACLDAGTGREIWAVDTLSRFEGKEITWGLAECLLVDGDRVIVSPGGRRAAVAALDVRTGETVWTGPPMTLEPAEVRDAETAGDFDSASYASPVLVAAGSRRQIIGSSSRHVYGVDAGTGGLLWKRPLRTVHEVIALVPVVFDDGVFITAPDSGGGKRYRLLQEGTAVRVEEVWTSSIDTCHGGIILAGGILVGTWYREYDGWGAVDAVTGRTLHRTEELHMGSVLLADGRYWCLAQDGIAALVEIDSRSFRIRSRFRFTEARRRDAWAHPVILDGRLYLRYHDRLECRDVRAR